MTLSHLQESIVIQSDYDTGEKDSTLTYKWSEYRSVCEDTLKVSLFGFMYEKKREMRFVELLTFTLLLPRSTNATEALYFTAVLNVHRQNQGQHTDLKR